MKTFHKLSDYNLFKYVSLGEAGTYQWVNLAVTITFGNKKMTTPFELDSIILYEKSCPISKYKLILDEVIA